MRYLEDGCPVYTATDLCDYLACGHLVTLKRRVASGEVILSDRSALSEVLARLGAGHERSHLELLRAKGLSVKAFEDDLDRFASSASELAALEAETFAAMAEGYDVIYQPTFFDGRWMGRADFLLRVETPSARWAWAYEAADAKLARRVRSEAILQLCEYSAHLQRLQGTPPAQMQVILGDGVEHSYRVRRVLRVSRGRQARLRVRDACRRRRYVPGPRRALWCVRLCCPMRRAAET